MIGAWWSYCGTDTINYSSKSMYDDVRIYDKALTGEQVRRLYLKGSEAGGGIYGHGASTTISKCIIRNNTSQANGGGIAQLNGKIKNCIIAGNTATNSGGAVADCYGDIINCTIVNNTASQGGGVFACGGFVRNSILWNNDADQINGAPFVRYSCIRDWTQGGVGNISQNPHFRDPTEDDYRLLLSSPCIDAGDPASEYLNEPSPNGGRINMGAYGNTNEAATTVEDRENYSTADDGIPDWWKIKYNLDPLYDIASQQSIGSQGHLTYGEEYLYGTNPNLYDTDSDGLPDWWAILYELDPLDPSNAGQISAGSDGMLTNLEEYWSGTNPNLLSTVDDDIPDWWKIKYGLDPLAPAIANLDSDGDGLTTLQEYTAETNPSHHNEFGMIIEYDYDTAGRIQKQRVLNGLETKFSVTAYEYDELGRQILQRQYQFNNVTETYTSNVADNDVVSLTVYDVLGDVQWSVQKVEHSNNPVSLHYDGIVDDPSIVQNGDIVTMQETRYEDVDSSANGMLEQVSETKVGHYASTGTINAGCAITTSITYYDRDDEIPSPSGDNIYCWTESIAPAHDDSGSRAITTSYYDGAGRVFWITDARNHYRTLEYDSYGQVIREIAWENIADPDPDEPVMQTRSVYDNLGRITRKVTMADAADSDGIDTTEDIVTDYTYDYDYPSGGTERNYPGQLVAQTIYYGSSSTDATTYYDYDALERRYKTTDPVGNTTELFYNASGQVIRGLQTEMNPGGGSAGLILYNDSYYEYDSAGRIASIIGKPYNDSDELLYDSSDVKHVAGTLPPIPEPLPSSWMLTTFYYDAAGRKIAEVKPNDVKTIYTYWAAGQKKTEVADAEGGVTPDIKQTTEWSYDRVGRLAAIAGYTNESDDGTRQETRYAYNDQGNVTDIYYPEYDENVSITKGRIQYAYFANGQVKQRTDQRGIVTTYAYDATGVNLLTKSATIASVTTTETFMYDAMGRMENANKVEGTTQISRSELGYYDTGYLQSETQKLFGDPTGKTVSYAYDTAGFRTLIGYPNTSPITLTRTNTPLGQIDTLSLDGTTNLVDYDYLGSRVAERTYPDISVSVVYGYDQYGRITDITAGSLVDFHYEYVPKENNIWKMRFDHRSGSPYNEYAYDDIDRLTGVTYLSNGSDTEAFVMDDLGNRAGNQTLRGEGTVGFAVDTLTNRYTSVGGHNLDYDDAGNLTTDKDGYVYTYDYENRIVKIEDDQQTLIAEFAYDTQGRRIKVYDAVAQTTTLYYYSDNWQVLAEYDDSGVQKRYFVYGNYIDEVLFMKDTDASDGTPAMNYYYLHDHLYSPVALLRKLGGVVLERYEYDAYGKMTRLNPNFTAFSGTEAGNPYYFTGRELDVLDGGGLRPMHYRHRAYDTHAGRFMQQDPLGIQPAANAQINPFKPEKQYTDGMNIYEYVGDGPISSNDSLGLTELHPVRVNRLHCKCKRECGPDITDSFFHGLERVSIALEEEFKKPGRNEAICGNEKFGTGGVFSRTGWDIDQFWGSMFLYDSERVRWLSKKEPCADTVVFKGHCVKKWELNYYLWGYVNRKCNTSWLKYHFYTDLWTEFKSAFSPEDPHCKRSFAGCGQTGALVDNSCYLDKCCKVSGAPIWTNPITMQVADVKMPTE